MSPALVALLSPMGIVLPQSTLASTWFAVLAAFVAINTVMYAALAFSKVLPKLYPSDWLPRRYTRSQTRGIHPEQDNPSARRIVPRRG